MRYLNDKMFDAAANASANSSPIDASAMVGFSVQASFTDAAAAGTLKVQFSNDHYGSGNLPFDFTPTNWSDITGASVVVAAGAVSAILFTNVSYQWLRLVWTRTAGAGTFTATLKSIGY